MRHAKTVRRWPRFTGWPVAAGVALCLGTGTVHAQQSVQNPPPPNSEASPPAASPTATTTAPAMQTPEPNTPVLVVDMRWEADIRRDVDAAHDLQPRAQADERKAGGDVTQSKVNLEIKRKELDALKDQLSLVKKQGNQSEFATLDRERGEEELRIKLLESYVAVRESQVELARARRQLADTSLLALESELEMSKKRTAWQSMTQQSGATAASAQDIVSLQVNIRSDERRVLQAMKVRSKQAEEVAEKDSQLIDRQLGVLEADTAIQQFGTRAH